MCFTSGDLTKTRITASIELKGSCKWNLSIFVFSLCMCNWHHIASLQGKLGRILFLFLFRVFSIFLNYF